MCQELLSTLSPWSTSRHLALQEGLWARPLGIISGTHWKSSVASSFLIRKVGMRKQLLEPLALFSSLFYSCGSQDTGRQHIQSHTGNFPLSLIFRGFPGGSVVKNPPANAGDMGLIPGSGRSTGGGNGNSL